MRYVLICSTLATFGPSAPAQPASDRPARPVAMVLAEEPIRLDAVGLSFRIPEGLVSQSMRVGGTEKIRIIPAGGEPAWEVLADAPRSSKREMTPGEVADAALKQILESVGVRRLENDGPAARPVGFEGGGQVIDRTDALRIDGCAEPGARFYVRFPVPDGGRNEPDAVRGYTVFRGAPGQFVVFELFTTAPALESARAYYEFIVANASLADRAGAVVERGAAVEAAFDLLARLKPEDLRAIAAERPELFLRSYREAKGGADGDAVEIGYQRVRTWWGRRGELDSARSVEGLKGDDRDEGLLVSIEGRTLLHDTDQLVDSVGTYFVLADRSEEAWTLQMAVRDLGQNGRKRPAATYFETGARSREALAVSITGKGQQKQQVQPMVPAKAYINQAEMLLLPQILMRFKVPGEYGFYTYQSQSMNVSLRRDQLEPMADRPGMWSLKTRVTEDAEPRVGWYDDTGRVVRIALPDKTIIEPFDPGRLMDLWARKGLPTK